MSLKIGLLLVSTATLFLSIVTIGQQKQLNELRKILNTITKTERDKLIDGLNTQVEDCLTEDEVEW